MIYGKILVILLSKITDLKPESPSYQIASFLLRHMNEPEVLSVAEIADRCHVSISSVSRFCREIGLSDFGELKELMESTSDHLETVPGMPSVQANLDLTQKISAGLEQVARSLDPRTLWRVARLIRDTPRVTAVGLLKAETAALNLQADLLLCGRFIEVRSTFDAQQEFWNQADSRDLVLVFSYTGTYFSEGLRLQPNRASKPTVVMISGQTSADFPEEADIPLGFESSKEQILHPYQLLFASSLIAQTYASLKEQELPDRTNGV